MKPTVRTTIGEYFAGQNDARYSGIYVIACYPCLGCLYVGISQDIDIRLRQHIINGSNIGQFITNAMPDSCGFRLDLFHIDDMKQARRIERQLIRQFRPTYNEYN
jgi:predicted GIY-YIG superfamily endonuclease